MANRFEAQTPMAVIVAGLPYSGIGESLSVVSYRSVQGWVFSFIVRRDHWHGGGAGTQPRRGAFAPGHLPTGQCRQQLVRTGCTTKVHQPRKHFRMDVDRQRAFL